MQTVKFELDEGILTISSNFENESKGETEPLIIQFEFIDNKTGMIFELDADINKIENIDTMFIKRPTKILYTMKVKPISVCIIESSKTGIKQKKGNDLINDDRPFIRLVYKYIINEDEDLINVDIPEKYYTDEEKDIAIIGNMNRVNIWELKKFNKDQINELEQKIAEIGNSVEHLQDKHNVEQNSGQIKKIIDANIAILREDMSNAQIVNNNNNVDIRNIIITSNKNVSDQLIKLTTDLAQLTQKNTALTAQVNAHQATIQALQAVQVVK